MEYKRVLTELLEKAILSFNKGNSAEFNRFFKKNLYYVGPKYNNSVIQEEAVIITDREDLFVYWNRLRANYPMKITDYEFLELGKVCRLRITMQELGYVIDTEIHLDEYGKIFKLTDVINKELNIVD